MPAAVRKRRLIRGCLVLAGLSLGVLAAEVAARWITPEAGYLGEVSIPPGLFTMGKDYLRVPRPGFRGQVTMPGHSAAISINSLGLRGPEPPRPLPSGGWITVGDSFTFAGQVDHEDTFQARLAKSTGQPIWNAGVDAYSTWEATARYRKLADVLPVKGVLLVFYLGNDLLDNDNPSPMGPPPDNVPPPPRTTGDAPALQRLLVRYSFVYAHLSSWWRLRQIMATDDQLEMWREEIRQFTSAGAALMQKQLPRTEAALTELKREAAGRGHRLLVAMATQAIQVERGRAEGTFELAGIDPASADLDAPTRALRRVLQRLQIATCDLVPALRAAVNDGARVHFTWDAHWTAAGHQVVARTLARCMERLPVRAGR